MRTRRRKAVRFPVMAAGGIVVRGGHRPLFAVVQRRKDNFWVLPKGKLKRGERLAAAAKREAAEETGQSVSQHEFLGAITSEIAGRQKIVHFWRMQVKRGPGRRLAGDIKAVEWLPLSTAIGKLTQPVERTFLDHIGGHVLKLYRASAGARAAGHGQSSRQGNARPARETLRSGAGKPPRRDAPGIAPSAPPPTVKPRAPSIDAPLPPDGKSRNILRQFLGKLRRNAALTSRKFNPTASS